MLNNMYLVENKSRGADLPEQCSATPTIGNRSQYIYLIGSRENKKMIIIILFSFRPIKWISCGRQLLELLNIIRVNQRL